MGFDVARFAGEVDEELICAICKGVLECPEQAPQCEHAFCSACIREWLVQQETCPVDRSPLSAQELATAPRILRNLLSRLTISCEFASDGCSQVVKLDCLQGHQEQCTYNPKIPVACTSGCGSVIPKDEVSTHNCVKEVRRVLEARIQDLEAEVAQLRRERTFEVQDWVKREFKEFVESRLSALSLNGPALALASAPLYGGRTEDEARAAQIQQWAQSLATAHVCRWGGMISTPDSVLQASIKRALLESGCPPVLCNELMENAHERRWPRGLNTLETRQMNRRRYEQYVTKRIPRKQAVVVLQCENQHMGDSMTVEPGLVMIFAHGVD
ncbi:E3 ubiquitin-protein ligase NRDP1-like [Sycon ciliatum]|uniref:E3 ubiquitin-protein ligase NRDP1-like n=1 Tax=Sycon ciliatum TaxID=27933 RepID=UPI0020A8FE2A|eukprot:scpid73603/ scgid11995/ E3 ubiquitin-protein ligase NRDP1; RING finger protein 41